MRLEEISRLKVKSFTTQDDINIIKITADEDWVGKTPAALRDIPIHPILENIGLLRFVDQQRKTGNERLFDLKRYDDGYGVAPGKWFTKYRRKCGVDSSKKTFHSLRHTFTNEMKQMKSPDTVIAAIVGHEDQSITTGRYGKAYNIPVLFEELSKVDFGIDHPSFIFNNEFINN